MHGGVRGEFVGRADELALDESPTVPDAGALVLQARAFDALVLQARAFDALVLQARAFDALTRAAALGRQKAGP